MAKSLLLLIDGYNVIAPTAPPGRASARSPAGLNWLREERRLLLRRLADHLPDPVRRRCRVVFDASDPPIDRPNRFKHAGIEVWFAVDYPEADDCLEEVIVAHHSPKRLAVVSSDHRIQTAAKRRGATPFDSQQWLDDLVEGRPRLAAAAQVSSGMVDNSVKIDGRKTDQVRLDADEVREWLDEFGIDPT